MDSGHRILSGSSLSHDQVILRWAGLAVLLVIVAAAGFYNPFESRLLVCQFRELTGVDCPTCGISRSMFSALHCHIGDSFRYHPFGVLFIVALLMLGSKFAIELLLRRRIAIIQKKVSLKVVLFTVTSVLVVNWIIKIFIVHLL